ncbi:MAG TPA: response regulator transcription factor [Solirubrobacteraceae bacterium]|nr:response regulator transcription factor [Solirubrobacteraceae bacterium]
MPANSGAPPDGTAEPITRVRVAIVDDRRLIGESLAVLVRALDGFVVTGAFDSEGARTALVAHAPDLLLVAVGADGHNALELIRALRGLAVDLKIVLLAEVLVPGLAAFVLDERLNGLILTDTPASDLATCLDQVRHGHAVMPADWHRVLARSRDDPLESLSERQFEVLELVAEGFSYEEIGARLFISSNTVKFHLRTIYLRLGVRNRVAAARLLRERSGTTLRGGHEPHWKTL